jgi:hypothetical protein
MFIISALTFYLQAILKKCGTIENYPARPFVMGVPHPYSDDAD